MKAVPGQAHMCAGRRSGSVDKVTCVQRQETAVRRQMDTHLASHSDTQRVVCQTRRTTTTDVAAYPLGQGGMGTATSQTQR